MAESPPEMNWSSSFTVAPTSRVTDALPGDKILLPQSALEQLLQAAPKMTTSDTSSNPAFDPFDPYSVAQARQYAQYGRSEQPELPHPLTFRLVNQETGNVVYAGIREFSAEEGEIGLSPFLREALGVKTTEAPARPSAVESIQDGLQDVVDLTGDDDEEMTDQIRVTVHVKQLPKGTYVRLRPLEAGYNPDDWRALLERHMRENYTTLTNNEVLKIPDRAKKGHDFRFLIDKFAPEGDGICVVDTDLEVDIEALNEEQARETLKQIMTKKESEAGSSVGGVIDAWKPVDGRIQPGDYVDYELTGWDRTQGIEIEIIMDEDSDIDLFASPLSNRQRARPREDEHVFGDFSSGVSSKRFKIQSSNIELEGAEALYISIHSSSPQKSVTHYTLRARIIPDSECNGDTIDLTQDEAEAIPGPDEEKCKNCHQIVPKRTMMLHENFCFRNNIVCPQCLGVFKKDSPEWKAHWHCEHDSVHGNNGAEGKRKHDFVFHEEQQCTSCDFEAKSLPELARHRTTVCPGKLILCRFCHLSVPQEGDPANPSAEELLSGLTAHELADGSRTERCYLCQKIVRLRDMETHMKHHELNKSSKPLPRVCRNINCGRTLDGVGRNGQIGTGQQAGNDLGLCSICFGPLYVSMHDPEGKAMKRRIERRYLSQLLTGCGKSWCGNEVCKSGKVNLGLSKPGESTSAKDALPLIQPLLQSILDHSTPMYFCVDEGSQTRRKLAEMMTSEGVYEFEWCIAALEAESGDMDGARQWLQNWAPKKSGSPK